jgi:hypothetical protein
MGECHIRSPNQWQIGWWDPSPCYQTVGAGASLAGKLFFRPGGLAEFWSMCQCWTLRVRPLRRR